MSVDVTDYKPEEITVKTVDNMLSVEAAHEEVKDGKTHISRQMKRKCTLPQGVHPDTVTSSVSKSGLLTVQAPARQVTTSHTLVGPGRASQHCDVINIQLRSTHCASARQTGNYISHVSRPQGVHLNTVMSPISNSGLLTVQAPARQVTTSHTLVGPRACISTL